MGDKPEVMVWAAPSTTSYWAARRHTGQSGSDRRDDSVGPQMLERWIRLVERDLPMAVRVVGLEDVDTVEAEPLEAGLPVTSIFS